MFSLIVRNISIYFFLLNIIIESHKVVLFQHFYATFQIFPYTTVSRNSKPTIFCFSKNTLSKSNSEYKRNTNLFHASTEYHVGSKTISQKVLTNWVEREKLKRLFKKCDLRRLKRERRIFKTTLVLFFIKHSTKVPNCEILCLQTTW